MRKLCLLSEGLFVNKGKSLHDFDLCLIGLLLFSLNEELLFIEELLLFFVLF